MGFAARGLWVTRSILAAVAFVAGSFCAVAKLSAAVVLVFVKKKNVLVDGTGLLPATYEHQGFFISGFQVSNLSCQSKDRNFWVATHDH